MRHGTTVLQALAGAACAVLLASCGTTEPVTGDVADEPAAQVEVSDREAEDDPADEKNIEPEHAAEEPVEEAGFDASAPVTNVTSDYGIDVTAPEGFLDTPEYAALEDEIASLADAGYSVSVRMITQGCDEINILIGVEEKDFERAVRAIYEAFSDHGRIVETSELEPMPQRF